MRMTKGKLRRIIRKTILRENKYAQGAKMGYGSGSLEADLSDEMALLFCYALDQGMSEVHIQDLAIRTLQSCRKGLGRR